MLASLADLLSERGLDLRQIDLTYREVTDLYCTLKEECRQHRPAAFVVTGIEASLKGSLLASLKIQRDLISRELRCPLLFWVSNFALTIIAREAPDFYDFRHTVFNFKSAGDRQPLMSRDTVPRDYMTPLDQARRSEAERPSFSISWSDIKRTRGVYRLATKWPVENCSRKWLATTGGNYTERKRSYIWSERSTFIVNFRTKAEKQRSCRLAGTYYLAGNQVKASENLAKALHTFQEISNRLGEADTLQRLGDVKYIQGVYVEAEVLYQQALETYRESGDRLGEAHALTRLGQVERQKEAYAEAERLYSAAFKIYASLDDRYNQRVTLLLLAEIYGDLGDREKARSLVDKAEELLAALPQMGHKGEHITEELL